jgi:hypothetical protein
MAEEESSPPPSPSAEGETEEICVDTLNMLKPEDVFVNGDADTSVAEDNSQDAMDVTLPDQVLPRKSSFMNKDGSRKPQGSRKKTVSFSSMPAERKIATGEFVVCLLHHLEPFINNMTHSVCCH